MLVIDLSVSCLLGESVSGLQGSRVFEHRTESVDLGVVLHSGTTAVVDKDFLAKQFEAKSMRAHATACSVAETSMKTPDSDRPGFWGFPALVRGPSRATPPVASTLSLPRVTPSSTKASVMVTKRRQEALRLRTRACEVHSSGPFLPL